ncbi:dTDP-4-dehydrorhamnose reductase [Streptomyces dysideae]|uniref:dTDP-4-dehydrorhamnose reductase n=1 Tax=Streptomyces dysideae TaxID=909626 RepID=A0A124IDI8_9ACTN|nr:dTDP-4-dehydrorhamnose reductase [Streptomyces dysideae]KUO15291.1 NAD(P)-dependent oxidoreductase [Streptomyces dysideae]
MTGAWLVTGAGGMLGQDVVARLAGTAGEPVVALERRSLDITDAAAVHEAVAAHRPAVVVNCAAWTAVDAAESQEAPATRTNADGARHLAAACARSGATLLQMSTDYVFSGDRVTPYPEDHPTKPRTAYGRSKLAGEQAVRELLPDTGLVVRTAWLYGAGGRSFVRAMSGLAAGDGTVDVVDDQYGQPTWSADLAALLIRLGRAARQGAVPPGVYHGTSAGQASWYELAREVFLLLGADPERVRPTRGADLGRAAPRPAYTVLGHGLWETTGIQPLRHWREALAQALPVLSREG